MVNWHQLTNFSRMTWEKWLKWWITLWYTALWHKYSIYFFFTSFVHTILTNTFIYSIERIKKWYFQRFLMKDFFMRVFTSILIFFDHFDIVISWVRWSLRCEQHSGPKFLPRVACLWSRMPMFQRVGIREGGKPLSLAFQYFIFMV